jgi:hypothetical protein
MLSSCAESFSSWDLLLFRQHKSLYDENKTTVGRSRDRLCGLVVRVLGYRSGGPGSIPGTNRKKKI